jgi:hypothetical protein
MEFLKDANSEKIQALLKSKSNLYSVLGEVERVINSITKTMFFEFDGLKVWAPSFNVNPAEATVLKLNVYFICNQGFRHGVYITFNSKRDTKYKASFNIGGVFNNEVENKLNQELNLQLLKTIK